MKQKLYIFDTTLRDGEQAPGCQLGIFEKVELAQMLEAMKVDVIECGFPVSSPGDFKSIVEISKVVRDSRQCALTRAVENDIDVAAEALKLIINGQEYGGKSSGNGPVDAAFKAVRELVGKQIKLEEYLVQAITGGTDDVGKVHIQIEHDGDIYYGYSANTDIVTASVEAYVNAIPKLL